MEDELTADQSTGQITSGITRLTLALKTVAFVRQQLPAWRDDSDRPVELSEDKLNSQLCKFLNTRARHEFPMIQFTREESQSGRRRADIGVSPTETLPMRATGYTIYDPFLVFECKRLPAPSSNREREYITGYEKENGGIQRFKMGLHGGEFDLAGMIGYIQERTAPDWHKKINEWISELAHDISDDVCSWSDTEALEPLEEDLPNGMACCRSVHSRAGRGLCNEITIHHLWIVMHVLKRTDNRDCGGTP